MRILIATAKHLDPRKGKGVAAWALDLQDAFARLGHSCWLLGCGAGRGPQQLVLPAGSAAQQAGFVAEQVEQLGIDAVLSASSPAALAAWNRLPPSCLRIVTVHAAVARTVRREAAATPLVDAFVGISNVVSQILETTVPRTCPVFSIPNGIRTIPQTVAPQTGRPPLALVVGRLEVLQKRSHWLPRIWQAVHDRCPDARLICLGDGPLAVWLRQVAAKTAGHFEVQAPVPPEQLHSLFGQARVLLLPSAYEGLSIAMLEAMAHGMVVVAAQLRATTADVLDAQNAVLVPCGGGLFLRDDEIRGFATAAVRVFADDDFAERRATAARQRIFEQHRMSVVAQRYLDMMARLQQTRQRRPTISVLPRPPQLHPGVAGAISTVTRLRHQIHLRAALYREQFFWHWPSRTRPTGRTS